MTNPATLAKEEIIREFPPISGKYRVMVLRNYRNLGRVLDVREYVAAPGNWGSFNGRGIRLSNRAQVDQLRDILTEVLKDLLM